MALLRFSGSAASHATEKGEGSFHDLRFFELRAPVVGSQNAMEFDICGYRH